MHWRGSSVVDYLEKSTEFAGDAKPLQVSDAQTQASTDE
jgi:hypothetical protein